MTSRVLLLLGWLVCLSPHDLLAEPFAEPGNMRLRHDLQLLSDYGALPMTLSSWPIAFPDVARALEASADVDANDWPVEVFAARRRLQRRVNHEARRGLSNLRVASRLAEPETVRGFADTPRENAEAEVSLGYLGDFLALRLQGTAVADPDDGERFRPDGSYGALVVGGWSVSAGYLDRWWGPGWAGSLLLSSNARPVPAIEVTRLTSRPFATPWLSWLGPWNVRAFIGQFTDSRAVSSAKLVGARFEFKPFPFLELGISRAAQWGGQGQQQNLASFVDLMIGDTDAETGSALGNQLGGFDMRINAPWQTLPVAIYGQVIGEDEAGYLPSKRFAMGGVEFWSHHVVPGSWRGYFEFANTTAGLFGRNALPDVAYEHVTYQSGYRFQGRSLGYSTDNDSRSFTLGVIWAKDLDTTWTLRARHTELNMDAGGHHTLAPEGEARSGALLRWVSMMAWGQLAIGLGAEYVSASDERSGEWEPQGHLSLRYGL